MRCRPAAFVLLLAAAGGAGAAEGSANCTIVELAQLAAVYRVDRIDARDEASPRWRELHAWDGPMHRRMNRLADCFVEHRIVRSEVIGMLADPDHVARGGERHATVDVPNDDEHLIYHWRGGHDYLYFVVRGGVVADSGWWFAGE